MSTSHPSPIHAAFDVIHEHVRKVERENLELRSKVNQLKANFELATQEKEDALFQVRQLRGALARRFGTQSAGVDVTAAIQVVG